MKEELFKMCLSLRGRRSLSAGDPLSRHEAKTSFIQTEKCGIFHRRVLWSFYQFTVQGCRCHSSGETLCSLPELYPCVRRSQEEGEWQFTAGPAMEGREWCWRRTSSSINTPRPVRSVITTTLLWSVSNIVLLQAIKLIRGKRPYSIETEEQVDSLYDFERHLNQKKKSQRIGL